MRAVVDSTQCACIYCCLCVTVLINCRHEAERLEQEAKGRLERQKIMDEAEAERARKELLELQAHRSVHWMPDIDLKLA